MSTESSGTAQTATSTEQAPRSEPEPQDISAKPEHGPRTATVNLPFVKAQFRAPEMHLPQLRAPHIGRAELSAAAHTGRSLLPPPRQALYYAGLAVLAAVEVIDWPVAAAIGVGTAVMGRRGEQHRQEATRKEKAADASAPAATPGGTATEATPAAAAPPTSASEQSAPPTPEQ